MKDLPERNPPPPCIPCRAQCLKGEQKLPNTFDLFDARMWEWGREELRTFNSGADEWNSHKRKLLECGLWDFKFLSVNTSKSKGCKRHFLFHIYPKLKMVLCSDGVRFRPRVLYVQFYPLPLVITSKHFFIFLHTEQALFFWTTACFWAWLYTHIKSFISLLLLWHMLPAYVSPRALLQLYWTSEEKG